MTEGVAAVLTLRLVPAAAGPVADDACIVDFPVTAVLTVSGDTAAALAGAVLETSHSFAAASFEDCTRELEVSVATKAPDGTYTPPRTLSFALAPAEGSDERILDGPAVEVTVNDDTIPPGPVVTGIEVTPEPAGAAAENDGPTFTLSEIQALGTGNRAHGAGRRVKFTLTFDVPVTVTGTPELVIGLFHGARRALYKRGSGTDTLEFEWTVQTGDIDPDGLAVEKLIVPDGASLRDTRQEPRPFVEASFPATAPKTRFPRHKVFGGLHGIRLHASGAAREGEPFTFRLSRTGGFADYTFAVVTVTDSAFPDIPAGAWVAIDGPMANGPGARVLEFDPEREKKEVRRVTATVTPPGDGKPEERTLTIVLAVTDVEVHEPESGESRTIYEPRGAVTVTVRVLDRGVTAARASAGPAVAGLPTVTEPGDDGVYAAGDPIEAEVLFDAPVTVDTADGSPVLGLALGGVRRDAAYAGGSGTAALTFALTVPEAADGAGQARAVANGIVLNGATVRGEGGVDAVLAFGEAPGVASVSIAIAPGGDGARDPGEPVEAVLVFEEPVEVATGDGTPSVGLLLGGATARAAYARGSGTDTLVFAWTLAKGDGPVSSVLVTADSLALNGGTIRSTGGLDAVLTHHGAGRAGAPRAALPALSVADATAAEGGTLRFAVTLAPAASAPVTVDWATSDGTAAAGEDYTAASGTLAFAAGETQKTVEVAATADDAGEAPETLTLTLSNPSGARLGDGEATGTVTQPGAAPLTGSFSAVPPEHDGSSAFLLTLAFSEEPEGLSYKTVRDTLFTVTGATVERARRLSPPSNRRFEMKLVPAGNAAVTLALAALPACGASGSVCTANGRALAGPLALTVPGPAALSVADASVDEGPGATLAFAVTLDRARHAAVTVDYATEDGTASAPDDYTAASGTLTFAAGQTEKTVEVAVVDDGHDDDGETMTFKLSNPSGARIADGEATGTIRNSDAIPKAWLARFGRTVADQVVEAVRGRFEASRTPGVEVTLAGERVGGASPEDIEALERREAEAQDRARQLGDWLQGGTQDAERDRRAGSRAVTPRDLLVGSAFSLTAETAGKGLVSLWGRGAVSRFDGREGDLSLDGEGGERHGRRRLDAGAVDGRADGLARRGRRRLPGRGARRQGREQPHRGLSLRALAGERARVGVGRGGLRRGHADADAGRAGRHRDRHRPDDGGGGLARCGGGGAGGRRARACGEDRRDGRAHDLGGGPRRRRARHARGGDGGRDPAAARSRRDLARADAGRRRAGAAARDRGAPRRRRRRDRLRARPGRRPLLVGSAARAERRGPGARAADPRVEGLPRARLLGRARLGAGPGHGPGAEAHADPDGGRLVLGRHGRAARARDPGRPRGQRQRVRGRRRRRAGEPAAGAEGRLRLPGPGRALHDDAGVRARPVAGPPGLQPRLAPQPGPGRAERARAASRGDPARARQRQRARARYRAPADGAVVTAAGAARWGREGR